MIINSGYTGIDDHFGTNGTGQVGTKKSRILYGYTMKCRLNDCVLFCVNSAAELMALTGGHLQLFAQAPDFDAVSNSAWGTVITGGKNSPILYNYRSHGTAAAGRSFCHQRCNIHKIRFPGRALIGLRHGAANLLIPDPGRGETVDRAPGLSLWHSHAPLHGDASAGYRQ